MPPIFLLDRFCFRYSDHPDFAADPFPPALIGAKVLFSHPRSSAVNAFVFFDHCHPMLIHRLLITLSRLDFWVASSRFSLVSDPF
jgi:hypothetical protein